MRTVDLPQEYNAAALEELAQGIFNQLDGLKSIIPMIPLSAAPDNPKEGWIALSDGTGTGFDGSSGAGLYRYQGGSWNFIG